MDWNKIREKWDHDGGWLKEFLRQHIQEHHGPHRHRFGDGIWVTGSELPMEATPEDDRQEQFVKDEIDPVTAYAEDMGAPAKPEVCECEPKIMGRSLVKNNWTHEWVDWQFCPKCGLKLKGGG